ncbi:MAG: glycosyltransferase [Clostridia bacterium]|nr:glycosyltransferase [Clostridia bacterium]
MHKVVFFTVRILHIGFSNNPGGVENVVMNYYRLINKEKFKFDFLDIYGDGIVFSDDITSLGGEIISLVNYKKHPIKFITQLVNLLKEQNYDIVHIHMQSLANILPVIAVKCVKNIKVICHSHSSSTPKGITRKVLHAINVFVVRKMRINKWACGVRAGKWMWGNAFCENNIIPNAIHCEKYKSNEEERLALRKECGFSEDFRVIGFIGRFGQEKNAIHLLDVLEELLKISDKYRLLTVGGNDLYDEFLKEAKARGLDKYSYFAGVRGDAFRYYKAMDAFLLPSFFEGFPLVGVEAQAADLPCFFSETISREIKISNRAYFLPIGHKTAVKWAESIDFVLKDKAFETSFDKNYNIENAVKNLENKYVEIL